MSQLKRGDVIMMNLPIDGSHVTNGYRPYLIVQNNVENYYSPTTIVVPLTTQLRKIRLPTQALVRHRLLRPSAVLCENIITVDLEQQPYEYRCTLSQNAMDRVDRALRVSIFGGGR